MKFLSHYYKAIAQALVTALAAVAADLVDGHLSSSELVNVAILVVSAASVLVASNDAPGAKYTKGALAFLGAALVAAASYLTGGFTTAEVLQVILAGAGALGVVAVPNAPKAPQVATPAA